MTLFETDVLEGLSASPKHLSSKYFYDAAGDKLFQDIMHMPEYYLTDKELEIFQTHRQDILDILPAGVFDLVELGAGDGFKTKVLLRHFLEAGRNFRYLPIDISKNVLEDLEKALQKELPTLDVLPEEGEYFRVLESLKKIGTCPKVVLFLGANIGNLPPEKAVLFLQELNNSLNPGDMVIIGFDLKKDPQIIQNAYDDPAGITAAFNLNLLNRMNQELGADFQIDQFKHWETYNPVTGETRSYIISKSDQDVYLKNLDKTFHFDAWEAISVELSLKYSNKEIDNLAAQTQFSPIQKFQDQQGYFVNVLWKVERA